MNLLQVNSLSRSKFQDWKIIKWIKRYKELWFPGTTGWAMILLLIGVLILFGLPSILVSFDWFTDFSNTGQIGDTIGGITTPFISLISAAMVFFALRAQIRANEIIVKQFEKTSEAGELNQLYQYINERIDNFYFISFTPKTIREENATRTNSGWTRQCTGAEGIQKYFQEVWCNSRVTAQHPNQSKIDKHWASSELINILVSIKVLLEKIRQANNSEYETLEMLVKHQFEYRVHIFLKDKSGSSLYPHKCSVCGVDHGLPEELRSLISEIRQRLVLEISQ